MGKTLGGERGNGRVKGGGYEMEINVEDRLKTLILRKLRLSNHQPLLLVAATFLLDWH